MKNSVETPFFRIWIMLLFFCMSMVSFSKLSFAVNIGDNYQGGIVFYVDGSGQHGLVAAKSDIPGRFDWASAKRKCVEFKESGYHDWFLPSKDQLKQMYVNKNVIGGFALDYYWSSSEESADYAWYADFYFGGAQSCFNKSILSLVRAVRAF